MTITPSRTDLVELRSKQQKMWSSGDYNRIAAITVPVAETLVQEAGARPGEAVLDVATGTGHAALAAARRGARVTGIDYVSALLDIAHRRAVAEHLDIDFVEAPAEELPFADEKFDLVVSAIGVMFAADHDTAAAELVRVTRPGGRIALASWTPTGFVGGMLAIVGRHVTPPAGARSPLGWGVAETVAELLGNQVAGVTSSVHIVTQRFADAESFADLFLSYYGPTFMAAQALSPQGREALRADLVAHAAGSASPGSPSDDLVMPWEYRIVTAERKTR